MTTSTVPLVIEGVRYPYPNFPAITPEQAAELRAEIFPAVIEGIDLEGEPTCDLSEDRCSAAASVRTRFWCGCPHLACPHHFGALVEFVNLHVSCEIQVRCLECGAATLPRSFGEAVVAVIPL